MRLKKVLHHCRKQDWDTKACRLKSKTPNSFDVNNLISLKLLEYEKAVFECLSSGREITKDIFADAAVH